MLDDGFIDREIIAQIFNVEFYSVTSGWSSTILASNTGRYVTFLSKYVYRNYSNIQTLWMNVASLPCTSMITKSIKDFKCIILLWVNITCSDPHDPITMIPITMMYPIMNFE